MEPSETFTLTRQAVAAATTRTAEFVAAVEDPFAPVPNSTWAQRDIAAHLIVVAGLYADVVQGTPLPIENLEPAYLAAESARRNADIAEHDPVKLARLLSDTVERFLDAIAGLPGDFEVTFQGGFPLTVAGVAGVLLGEELLHGYDLAVALGRPWPIAAGDAALVLAAYAPLFALHLNRDRTRHLTAGFGLELRGAGEMTVRFTDGAYGVEPAGTAPVDATISADPVAFLLVGSGRLAQHEAVALGLMSFGGARPELGLAFGDLFVYP